MDGLTAVEFDRACRIFLRFAYPAGEEAIPASRRFCLGVPPEDGLDQILAAPLCEEITGPEGEFRGYSLRLGSMLYPHLKMQIIDCDRERTWVFTVETHDALRLPADHPDADLLERLQLANHLLKVQIESAWEEEGLLTFNALLRRGLE